MLSMVFVVGGAGGPPGHTRPPRWSLEATDALLPEPPWCPMPHHPGHLILGCNRWISSMSSHPRVFVNGNFRILKWRYVSTIFWAIFLAIFCGDIPLYLKWPLVLFLKRGTPQSRSRSFENPSRRHVKNSGVFLPSQKRNQHWPSITDPSRK